MFSGIIEEAGVVTEIRDGNQLRTIRIQCVRAHEGTAIGDSVAVNGVCLTVIECAGSVLSFQVVAETLRRTDLGTMSVGSRVNLERSIQMGERNSGHFVFGHVDGVIRLEDRTPDGECFKMRWSYPDSLRGYFAEKGSVAINGVSLTLGEVTKDFFYVYIIPHTAQVTTLGEIPIGGKANCEVDMLSRYVRAHLAVGLT